MSQVTGDVPSAKSGNPKHEQARRQIETLLGREKDRDAYSQAKALFRLDTSPATRQLLERAYLLRIQSLVRAGMPAAAKEVALSFLTLGVTEDSLIEPLVTLLPRIGLGDRAVELSGRLTSSESQARLALSLADQAVLHPEQASPLASELRQTAGKIRDALSAILDGNEAAATELLDGIPRQSPYADWKLLARGLAAYYREDANQAAANWDRLEAGRAPHAIAAALRRTMPAAKIAGTSPPASAKGSETPASTVHAGNTTRLETHVFGEPVLVHLEEVQKALGEGEDWKRVFQILKIVYGSFRRTGLELGARLTEIILEPLVEAALARPKAEGERLLRDFIKIAAPHPLDPHWNRLWALVWAKADGQFEFSLPFWRSYLADIDQLTGESTARRQLLKALVWEEIGDIYAKEGNAAANGRSDYESESDDCCAQAASAFGQSLALRPMAKTVYFKLADLHRDEHGVEGLRHVLRDMLANFPNDFEVVERVFREATRATDAPLMLEAAQHARRLKPLDPRMAEYERRARSALARHHACAKRWDEARRELDLATDPGAPLQAQVLRAAQHAAVEFKAGKKAAGEQWIATGTAIVGDPALFWMTMSIEAAQYRLTNALQNKFSAELTKALGRKKSGVTASALANLIVTQRQAGVSSRCLVKYEEHVGSYLAKCTRVKFTEEELEAVVSFYGNFKDDDPAKYAQFARRGAKAHTDSAFFCYHLAQAGLEEFAEFGEGSLREAQKYVKKAAQLAARPGDRHASLLPAIRELQGELSKIDRPFSLADLFGFGFPTGHRGHSGTPTNGHGFPDLPESFFKNFFTK